MAGRNDAVLVTSTVLEWQKACIDCVTRKKDYAPLVYRLAPHIGFEHRAISDLRVFALDYYVCHFIGDQTDKVQFAELELPKKVYRQTLQDCMKNSLDIFSHIPLQVWVEAAFNIDGKVLTEFRDYHIRLGRQLQAKEMVVSGEFLAEVRAHNPFLRYSLDYMRGLHPDPVFAFKGLLKRMTEPLVPLLCISPDLSIDRNLMVLDRFTKTYDELREHLRRDSGSLPIWEVFHYMFWKAAEASLDELKTS